MIADVKRVFVLSQVGPTEIDIGRINPFKISDAEVGARLKGATLIYAAKELVLPLQKSFGNRIYSIDSGIPKEGPKIGDFVCYARIASDGALVFTEEAGVVAQNGRTVTHYGQDEDPGSYYPYGNVPGGKAA